MVFPVSSRDHPSTARPLVSPFHPGVCRPRHAHRPWGDPHATDPIFPSFDHGLFYLCPHERAGHHVLLSRATLSRRRYAHRRFIEFAKNLPQSPPHHPHSLGWDKCLFLPVRLQ